MLVNVKIKAPSEISEDKREPLDLMVVLDISSSMNGASKLDLCKSTLDFIVSQLSPSDRLGLVTFSNTVKTVQGLTKMDEGGKQKYKDSVKRVRAQGMTNLSGGLLKGVSEVMSQRQDGGTPNQIQSVLLLTDGMANVGIKDKDTLVDLLRQSPESSQSSDKKSSESNAGLPFSVFTFGFGSDHNVELLKAVSDCANGVYYFIDDLDKVGNAFGDCLGGLLSIVAQNTTLTIAGANGSSVGEVFTDYPNSRKADKAVTVDLGDLYAEEERNILSSIELKFPKTFENAKEDTQAEICRVTLSCVNLVTRKPETKELLVCVNVRPKGIPLSEEEKQENLTIQVHYNRWETSQTMQKADKMCDNLQYKADALRLLDERMNKLQTLERKTAEEVQKSGLNRREFCLLSEMQSDLAQCRATVQKTTSANISGKKAFMMNKMNKLCRERANSFDNYSDEDSDDDAFDEYCSKQKTTNAAATIPKKKRSVLENRSKRAYKASASGYMKSCKS